MESETAHSSLWKRFVVTARRRLDLSLVIALTVLSFMIAVASATVSQAYNSSSQNRASKAIVQQNEQLQDTASALQKQVSRSAEITACLRQLDSNVTNGISRWQNAVTAWLSGAVTDREGVNKILKEASDYSSQAAAAKDAYTKNPVSPCPV